MDTIDYDIVAVLKTMGRNGTPVPTMLRHILHVQKMANNLQFGQYLMKAFGLELLQVKIIGGWSADGSGEISDSQLHESLIGFIKANEPIWDQ
ncbi:MAG: hypothetical protein AB7K24_21205 [Gemmataceae bacterium]